MGKSDVDAISETMFEAFTYAQERRKEVGLVPLPRAAQTLKSGPNKGVKRPGPKGYKMTVWLTPDEYVTLLRYRARVGSTMGPTGIIKKFIRESLLPKSERPTQPLHLPAARPQRQLRAA